MARAADRAVLFAVPPAAALLLWPALWNGFPIVFADTGTYLSQAIDHYAGWDRPVFYSLFMLPLHATLTVWPVIVVQALLAAWLLWLVCEVLLPSVSGPAFVAGVAVLSACTWLPWIVSELMPDLFTPLLVLLICMLAWTPERLSAREQATLCGLATFMIASQLSSLPLSCALLAVLSVARRCYPPERSKATQILSVAISAIPVPIKAIRFTAWASRFASRPVRANHPGIPGADARGAGPTRANPTRASPTRASPTLARPTLAHPVLAQSAGPAIGRRPTVTPDPTPYRRWLLVIVPPALAVIGLCTVNLAAHGRFAVSPFGNVFLLARVVYDGPGMAALRRGCPTANWLLCPYLDSFPATSDDFLWTKDSPLYRAGGPKIVSRDAGPIIETALRADLVGEARAALGNTLEQMNRFASGDGLNPWPAEVTPTIERDFPERERSAYTSARQQAGSLSVPSLLARIHAAIALGGAIACAMLLPVAFARRAACAGFLLAVLVVLPLSAAITGSLSTPHDRYQARIMWLPPFIAVVSLVSLCRRLG
jgi:hypothetical protein